MIVVDAVIDREREKPSQTLKHRGNNDLIGEKWISCLENLIDRSA